MTENNTTEGRFLFSNGITYIFMHNIELTVLYIDYINVKLQELKNLRLLFA